MAQISLALFANRVGGSRSEPPVVDTGCYGAVASNHPGARNEEARVEYTKQLYTLHISKVWKFGAKKDCSAVKWIVWV